MKGLLNEMDKTETRAERDLGNLSRKGSSFIYLIAQQCVCVCAGERVREGEGDRDLIFLPN